MFNEGDRVRIRNNGAGGTVMYAEDGYYSVELDTGAEMDFENTSLLMTEYEYVEERKSLVKSNKSKGISLTAANMPYIPRRGDRQLATKVINMIKQIYPVLLDAMLVKNNKFNTLDDFDKVKTLSEITGTPMVVFMGAIDIGGQYFMRQVINKTILNNLVSNSDLVSDILLGSARRTIAEYEGESNG